MCWVRLGAVTSESPCVFCTIFFHHATSTSGNQRGPLRNSTKLLPDQRTETLHRGLCDQVRASSSLSPADCACQPVRCLRSRQRVELQCLDKHCVAQSDRLHSMRPQSSCRVCGCLHGRYVYNDFSMGVATLGEGMSGPIRLVRSRKTGQASGSASKTKHNEHRWLFLLPVTRNGLLRCCRQSLSVGWSVSCTRESAVQRSAAQCSAVHCSAARNGCLSAKTTRE